MLNEELQKAFNDQINAEFASAYLYLAMAASFDGRNFSGFARWMRAQAREELEHGMKFYHHMAQRGNAIELQAIPEPPRDWAGPLEVFRHTYEHERKVTARIHALVDLAMAKKDHAAREFLAWFINEQVEEEATANAIVQKLNLLGNSTAGILMLDHELGKRE